MPRQSVTISTPNDEWLKGQVSADEYATKSEAINDLIRQARRKDEEKAKIIAALIEGEQSGESMRSPDDIIAAVLASRGIDSKL